MSAHIALPVRLTISVALMLAGAQFAPARAAETLSPSKLADCGPIREVTDLGGLLDYRLRNVDTRTKNGVAQINRYHTEPARRALSTTPTNQSIMNDLDFTLRHSPNHVDALRLLMEYGRMGGQPYEYPALECYFAWAVEYTPTDISVLQLAAQYYWKSGNYSQAEELYTQGLAAEPESAELHYSAGLFYFSRKDYSRAREHARSAYAAGYPLPGLRSMLERMNQWNDTPPVESATRTPSSATKKN